MNIFKKAFCRIYQTAFHAALPLLPYREPRVFESINDLPALLDELNIRSVLLVTDSYLRKSGMTSYLESILKMNGIACAVYDGTRANPTVHNVEEACKMFLENSCQALIAFGGGSSIDCAKAVGARIVYPKKALDKLKGNLRVLKKIPTLIAIPTTAGTGSEVTLTAVITDPEKHHKYTMNDFPLIPSYAVLDPKVTMTLPPSLTATTGMDALTHAIEAYIGRSTSKATRKMALQATALIFNNIETAYNNGSNSEARSNMLRASYLAGNAFSQSYVGYIHAIAHSLGGQYNTPHGLANSVLMPVVLEAYGGTAHKKLKDLAISAGVANECDTPEAAANKFIAEIRALNERMGIPETLPDIRKEDIPTMVKHAEKEANPLYPVPKLMDADELKQFYYKVADWSKT